MRYGEICSGINAPSVAWHSMGWQPEFFSEIDKFPSSVSAHRWPGVLNAGDFTKIKAGDYGKIDLLVGGTPCQSFSMAGQRGGLDDARGNLTIEFANLFTRLSPRWFIWENVPGVFSLDEGTAFGRILAKFAGYPRGHVFQPPKGGWRNHGIVKQCDANSYGLAWCVRDAQYVRVDEHAFAVPQRRRRVFIVGYLGDWRRATAVLFEREGLRGDSPPCRKTGQAVAALTSNGLGTCGVDDNQAQAGHLVSHALKAHRGRIDGEGETFIPIAFDCKGSEVQFCEDGSHPTLRSMGHNNSHANAGGHAAVAIQERAISENIDAGPDGAGFSEEGAAYTLEARTTCQAVATNYAVRRLTPLECERLQGFPDGYTQIPWGKKGANDCPDGPRYKALGNSMAVNVMRWIGQRIELADRILLEAA